MLWFLVFFLYNKYARFIVWMFVWVYGFVYSFAFVRVLLRTLYNACNVQWWDFDFRLIICLFLIGIFLLLFDELVLFVSPLNKLLSFSLLYYLIFPSYFVYTYDRFVHLHKFIMFNRNLRVIFHVFFAALKVKINCRDYIFPRFFFFLHSEFLLLHKVCLSRKMKRFGNVKLLKRLSIVL